MLRSRSLIMMHCLGPSLCDMAHIWVATISGSRTQLLADQHRRATKV